MIPQWLVAAMVYYWVCHMMIATPKKIEKLGTCKIWGTDGNRLGRVLLLMGTRRNLSTNGNILLLMQGNRWEPSISTYSLELFTLKMGCTENMSIIDTLTHMQVHYPPRGGTKVLQPTPIPSAPFTST